LDGPYACNANGIFAGVLWMAGTLVFLYVVCIYRKFALQQVEGYILISLYFVYLVITIFTG